MSAADHEFWTTPSEYHDLAKMFERNIECVHPDKITCSDCPLSLCGWCAQAVNYYEYRGERV